MLVSDDGQFTLRVILEKYPECRREAAKLESYLGDLLPCKEWQRRLLVTALRRGIVKAAGNEQELKRQQSLKTLHLALVDDDGFSEDKAWWAIQEWCEALQVPFPAALASGQAPAAAPGVGSALPGAPGLSPAVYSAMPAGAAPSAFPGAGAPAVPTVVVATTSSGGTVCPKCGMANGGNSKFCGSCGAPLQLSIVCPACGTGNAPGNKFCNGCGANLVVSSTSQPAGSWSSIKAMLHAGEQFTFGQCPQGADNRMEPIEWLVLRRDSDGLLVISSRCLDTRKYYGSSVGVAWANCGLRRWLNNEFYRHAFTESERSQILPTSLHNNAGPDTQDFLFLLSIEEAQRLFRDNQARRALPTEYAERRGAQVEGGYCLWWLRSRGNYDISAATVTASGEVRPAGCQVDFHGGTVRPALKLAW